MSTKISIIGGGIVGLGIGWYLARAGYETHIFERDVAGRAASWAAGGMLPPEIETEPTEKNLYSLSAESLNLWPEFAAQLESASSAKIHFQKNGSMMVARDADDIERLKFLHKLHQDYGLDPEYLSGYDARKLEPHLGRNIVAAIHHPNDAHVDNRACVKALITAFQKSGGKLHEQASIESVEIENNRITGLVCKSEKIKSDIIINAAGAWAAEIQGLPEHTIPPVRPVKGQMIALTTTPHTQLIRKLIWSPDVYLIPQPGRLLIGASVEEMGFNNDLTAGAQMDLLNEAYRILPGIYDLPILESWTGFRPTSRDDAPILGPTEIDGLILATGHHRNGILLAPLTAQSIFSLIHNGQMPAEIQDFTIARFAA
ncbi:MAG: glycine oxidase ThiO [Alphaproteobacteria bacterium]|nr:MAG: glycine oxidase ThiO [Alphaproteobacteria bacterium]